MNKRLLVVCLVLSFLIIVLLSFRLYSAEEVVYVPTATPSPTVIPTTTPIPEIHADKLTELVNEWRVLQGYQPYIHSEFACSVAEKRVPQIRKDWSHQQFLSTVYCHDCTLGENLARGYDYESELLQGWLDSPTHHALLEAPYTHGCIATDGYNVVLILSYF